MSTVAHEAAVAAETYARDGTFWMATIIFILAYAVIVSEKMHKTVVAGASLMITLKILQQHGGLSRGGARRRLECDLPAHLDDDHHQSDAANRFF